MAVNLTDTRNQWSYESRKVEGVCSRTSSSLLLRLQENERFEGVLVKNETLWFDQFLECLIDFCLLSVHFETMQVCIQCLIFSTSDGLLECWLIPFFPQDFFRSRLLKAIDLRPSSISLLKNRPLLRLRCELKLTTRSFFYR